MSYGCPSVLNGSPVGGGQGYLEILKPTDARYVVGTGAELNSALASSVAGQAVYVADGATCLVTSGISVPPGVWLAAGRGRAAVPGMIKVNIKTLEWRGWVKTGKRSRVTGIDLVGPDESTAASNNYSGVIAAEDVDVDNCNIHGFGFAGVYPGGDVGASGVRVHHNEIHHNQRQGLGYGVLSNGTSGLPAPPIYEANYFHHNRHHHAGGAGKAGNGRYASFEFRYNLLGISTNTQLDVHGLDKDGNHVGAGGEWSFHHNTSTYAGQGLVGIRGIPMTMGRVFNNWWYGDETAFWSGPNSSDAWVRGINEQLYRVPGYGHQVPYQKLNGVVSGPYPWVRMDVRDNWYGSNPPPPGRLKMSFQ